MRFFVLTPTSFGRLKNLQDQAHATYIDAVFRAIRRRSASAELEQMCVSQHHPIRDGAGPIGQLVVFANTSITFAGHQFKLSNAVYLQTAQR